MRITEDSRLEDVRGVVDQAIRDFPAIMPSGDSGLRLEAVSAISRELALDYLSVLDILTSTGANPRALSVAIHRHIISTATQETL